MRKKEEVYLLNGDLRSSREEEQSPILHDFKGLSLREMRLGRERRMKKLKGGTFQWMLFLLTTIDDCTCEKS